MTTRAIRNFPVASNRKDLRRFFGIVNYLEKFPLLSDKTHLFHQLLERRVSGCGVSDKTLSSD